MQSRDRIGAWTKFVKDRWEKETPAVRDEITKQAKDENATLFKEWKQKAAFASTPEDLVVLRQLWLHSGFSREPTSANMLAELSHIWL
jgi:hypothetical protein